MSSSKSNSSRFSSQISNSSDIGDYSKSAECIRNRSNFSTVKSFHLIDKKDFDPDMLNIYIKQGASPKLDLLLEKIRLLDEQDLRTTGKLHKHLIFTDVNNSKYGVKIIASALAASGLNLVMHPQGSGFAVYPNETLLETKSKNFAVLISKSFFDRSMNTKIRKNILEKYNSRPENTHGELIRFIILDQGFKEGIDLFDVKYVHLFEPLTVKADEKQAIGRATRFCGQKGLTFHPTFGWTLWVFKYDVNIPERLHFTYLDTSSLFQFYLKYANIDLRKITFASELEKTAKEAAVDFDLTKSIHSFSINDPSPILKGGTISKAPPKIMNLLEMRQYIQKHFMRNRYPRISLENNCVEKGGQGDLVSFTPTQEFIRQYFQPESAYKGILLHHSVGTGKTCTAIATATTSWDLQGYTILWVTRHTLKSDIWKNMYKQVCSIDVQNQIKNGLVLPKNITNKFKYISSNWMEPISYKQFSNMLLKKNKIYNEMVRRNGEKDPLHKTLLIIDEAHKLYSEAVAKSEKPNTDILEEMIHSSYKNSGKDSVRVMLMTATPFTEDSMEMIKLLNLLRKDALPSEFDTFSKTYLDDQGYFSKKGFKLFQDEISGYISYLNRSQDARNFAHPVIQNVFAPLSTEQEVKTKLKNKFDVSMKELKEQTKVLKERLKDLKAEGREKKKDKEIIKKCIEDVKEKYQDSVDEAKYTKKQKTEKCKDLPVKQRKDCREDVIDEYNEIIEDLKASKEAALLKCKQLENDDLKEVLKEIDEINKQIEENKEKVAEFKEQKMDNQDILKNLKAKMKEEKTLLRSLKNKKKYDFENIFQEIKKIKKIKNVKEKKEALKEFKKSKMFTDFKELKEKIKEITINLSKNIVKSNTVKIHIGKKEINKISQDFNLEKHCNLGFKYL